MDKVGCNHLIIAGHLDSANYAKADFLSMHLEQHLQFTIDRQGKLKSQWDEYYQNVLVPLEITSPEYEKGETVVYTREGRVIGGFEEFKEWAKTKYNVDIEYDDERISALNKVHVDRAENAIADSNTATFDEKVDALLKDREEHLNKMNKVLDSHKSLCESVQTAINELSSYQNVIQPHIDALYALHKYPVKEEHPEEEEKAEQEEKDDGNSTENDGAAENEGAAENDTETSEANTYDESEKASQEKPEENHEDDDNKENNGQDEDPTAAAADEQATHEKTGDEEEEKQEKPKEEEEEGEPDPDAIDAQLKMQEGLKFPNLDQCVEISKKLGDNEIGLVEFVEEIRKKANECSEQIKEEKFKWKKLETNMLALKEKLTVTQNMLKISVLSAEELQIKAVQTEIDNYDNFIIPNCDQEVLSAAAIKFAATFQFA